MENLKTELLKLGFKSDHIELAIVHGFNDVESAVGFLTYLVESNLKNPNTTKSENCEISEKTESLNQMSFQNSKNLFGNTSTTFGSFYDNFGKSSGLDFGNIKFSNNHFDANRVWNKSTDEVGKYFSSTSENSQNGNSIFIPNNNFQTFEQFGGNPNENYKSVFETKEREIKEPNMGIESKTDLTNGDKPEENFHEIYLRYLSSTVKNKFSENIKIEKPRTTSETESSTSEDKKEKEKAEEKEEEKEEETMSQHEKHILQKKLKKHLRKDVEEKFRRFKKPNTESETEKVISTLQLKKRVHRILGEKTFLEERNGKIVCAGEEGEELPNPMQFFFDVRDVKEDESVEKTLMRHIMDFSSLVSKTNGFEFVPVGEIMFRKLCRLCYLTDMPPPPKEVFWDSNTMSWKVHYLSISISEILDKNRELFQKAMLHLLSASIIKSKPILLDKIKLSLDNKSVFNIIGIRSDFKIKKNVLDEDSVKL